MTTEAEIEHYATLAKEAEIKEIQEDVSDSISDILALQRLKNLKLNLD